MLDNPEPVVIQRTMKFARPVFHPGVNATIRRGVDWANLQTDQCFRAITPDGALQAILRHERTQVFVWNTLKHSGPLIKDFLKMLHDPDLNTIAALENFLNHNYPEFNQYEVVSIVVFTVMASFQAGSKE